MPSSGLLQPRGVITHSTTARLADPDALCAVSVTATGGYEIVDGVILRVEYRYDDSDRPIFDDHDSFATDAGPVGQRDDIHLLQVQLMWTPATGLD